jgi:5-methylcytosine-specific restriction endonuclease McrA
MARVCVVPGCGIVLGDGERCPRHRANAGGSTWAWRKVRAKVLARDRHRCVRCGAPAVVVHHARALGEGGRDDPRNLASLCARCHAREHRAR